MNFYEELPILQVGYIFKSHIQVKYNLEDVPVLKLRCHDWVSYQIINNLGHKSFEVKNWLISIELPYGNINHTNSIFYSPSILTSKTLEIIDQWYLIYEHSPII